MKKTKPVLAWGFKKKYKRTLEPYTVETKEDAEIDKYKDEKVVLVQIIEVKK